MCLSYDNQMSNTYSTCSKYVLIFQCPDYVFACFFLLSIMPFASSVTNSQELHRNAFLCNRNYWIVKFHPFLPKGRAGAK